jgi:hypothetical protein
MAVDKQHAMKYVDAGVIPADLAHLAPRGATGAEAVLV